ncbi:MAG TPA: HEPN domain-containing protein [Sulfolobales archaeon]|nr:HEPN domain-containing protein [Sulfolobales archaeon]
MSIYIRGFLSYDRYRDWLDEAIDDLEAAGEMQRLGRYSKACFFSHQAAEKALLYADEVLEFVKREVERDP